MKKKLLFAAAMLLAAVGVNAQTDVTSTYLTNADFEASTALTSDFLYGYSKDGSPSGFQAVDGWSYTILKYDGNEQSGMGGGVIAYGSNTALKGNNQKAPSTEYTAGEKNALGFFGVWSCGGYYYQKVEFPAGGYELTIPVYNAGGSRDFTSYTGFIPDEGTSHTSTTFPTEGQWTPLKVRFTLTEKTSGRIAIGYQSTGGGSSANPHLFFESVTITWTDPLVSLKAEYQEALAAAQAAQIDEAYSCVTGEEKVALANAIKASVEETEAGYSTAINALTNATNAFKAAKTSYDSYVAAKNDVLSYTTEAWPYASAAKATALNEASAASEPTNAEDAATKAAAIVKAYRQFVESNGLAEGVEGAVDMTSSLTYSDAAVKAGWSGIGTNTNEGYTDGEGRVSNKYFDGGWSSSAGANIAVTQEVTLPAGEYLLQITARGATALDTYTMSVGETSLDLPKEGSTGGTFGRGWSDKYITFESDGTTPTTIAIKAQSTTNQQWVSFNRLRLIRLKLNAEMATAEDYAALEAAIETAEAKTLGFDADEYAPYNNIEALQVLAAAKAIDTQVENEKAGVVNATEALTNAPWTANTAEVNAIFDGGFKTDYSSQSGQVQPIGWYRIQGTDGDGYNVRYMGGTDAGLAATSTGKAMFTKTAAYYGWADGYTMPLNENTYYEVTFVYGGWGDCKKDGFVTITDPQGNNIELSIDRLPLDAVDGNTNPNSWKQYRGVFKTGDAGNYVLGLRKDNERVQSQYVYGDFKLVKATPTTIDEDKTLAVGKYATRIYPFAPTIDGINFYSCATADGNTLSLVKVETPQACVPYILGNDADNATEAISIEQTGVDIHGKDSYTDGFLTGVFAPTTITEGYVLQTQEGKQAFYIVNSEKPITVPAYRAYLTVSGSDVKSFNLGDDTTGISALEALTNNAFEAIYSADGVKLNRIEKGVNILKMSDGTTRKVILK